MPRPTSPFRAVGRIALRTPVLSRTRVVRINGRERVESVTVEHLDTGRAARSRATPS